MNAEDHNWPEKDRRRCESCGKPKADDADDVWHDKAHPECSGGCGVHLCWDEECEDPWQTQWKDRALAAEKAIGIARITGEAPTRTWVREHLRTWWDRVDIVGSFKKEAEMSKDLEDRILKMLGWGGR